MLLLLLLSLQKMYSSEKQACESAVYSPHCEMETSGRVKWAYIVIASVGQQLQQLKVDSTCLVCDEVRADWTNPVGGRASAAAAAAALCLVDFGVRSKSAAGDERCSAR